jgi:hypothetical protein
MSIETICVAGYGWSGSGAIVDLLSSLNGYGALDFEFSMVWEPNGILDLEQNLVKNWDLLRSDDSIRTFLKYCQILSRKNYRYYQWGGDYEKKLGTNYLEKSIEYVRNLTDYSYSGNTRLHQYYLTPQSLILKKILNRFAYGVDHSKNMHFAKPTPAKFLDVTKNYLRDIFENYCKVNNIKTLVLDQSIAVSNIGETSKYFHNQKSIIVDRDPRDIYVDLVNYNVLIGKECRDGSKESTEKFIELFLKQRESVEDRNSLEEKGLLLTLKFEDIVLDCDVTMLRVLDYLGEDCAKLSTSSLFNIGNSIDNIGMFKKHSNQDAITRIGLALKEYCYH